MSRSRPVTGLLVALTLGLVGAGLVTTSASAAPEKLIQGVVVDQGGRAVLDVSVVAVKEDGVAAASDLSYENTDADGDPQRGYFALHVGARGTYTVMLSKNGYVSETISGVTVNRKSPRASLGAVTLTKKLVETKTSGKLVDSSVTVGSKGKVKVTVTPAGEKPTGDVEVTSGKKVVGSGELKAQDKGELTLTLKKLDKGSHDLKVSYDGSKFLKGSTSDRLTLVVKAAKRSRQVPNALAFVG